MHLKKPINKNNIFDYINIIIMTLVLFITTYPFWLVLISSVSSPDAVIANKVWFTPKGFQLEAYKLLLSNAEIITGYYNTIWYVIVGTSINIILTTMGAFCLSRRTFSGRVFFTFIVTFTMFFSGGMIPTYLLMRDLRLINTRWVIVLVGAVNAWNMIMMRTYMESNISESIYESIYIDGGNDFSILLYVVVPLSKPVLAVMVLFYGVDHWNSFFNALIYLNDTKLQPVQLMLRTILIQNEAGKYLGDMAQEDRQAVTDVMKYAMIIIATLPIMCVYPFLQKYFVKGIMVGSLKG